LQCDSLIPLTGNPEQLMPIVVARNLIDYLGLLDWTAGPSELINAAL
jgi:hypothetical protein